MTEAAVELGYVVGLDLGKLNDFTAIAVLRQSEQIEVVDEREQQMALERRIAARGSTFQRHTLPRLGSVKARNAQFDLVHLDRVPLGTSYPAIVELVADLMHRPPVRGVARLIVDSTGVGVPVVDLLEAEGLRPVPVTITSGTTVSSTDRGGWHVPKRDLVDTLAVLLQTRRLAIARDLQLAQALTDEMLSFESRVTRAGNDTYGARDGAHDDLVLAVAIATWWGLRHRNSHPSDWISTKK